MRRVGPFIQFCLLAVLLLAGRSMAAAVGIPSPPTADIYLADYVQLVNTGDRQQILDIGNDLDKRFGAQLVVVSVNTLDGADIENYSNTLFRSWGIGDAAKNNGVLLLIAKDDRKFRIEVGYGLEGAITDGYAGEVLDAMRPMFKAGDYSAGILAAYQKLASKIYVEYGESPPESLKMTNGSDEEWTLEDCLYFAIFIALVLVMMALYYFVLSPAVELFICTVCFIFNMLFYIISFGHFGSLNIKDSYRNFGRRHRGSGYRGSRSRGGEDSVAAAPVEAGLLEAGD